MSFSNTTDYFELFGMQPAFAIDMEQLSMRFRELQRSAHPDRYASASAQDKRLSVQNAALINEAYQTLRSPLSRGRYLLQRYGANLDDTDTSMDPAFLMEQMELREALAAVSAADDPFDRLDGLRNRIEGKERDMVAQLQHRLDEVIASQDSDALQQGLQLVRKMQFMQRLLSEVDELEDNMVHLG